MAICSSCGRESPEEFGFCPGCGATLAPAAAARDVRKVVTVLFCDLTGSTALGDRTDPEALRMLMRRYYDAARGVLERHGGTVEKFVGDAVMAVFGVPTASEDDALRAVRAAVELRDEVHALSLEARLGVNTGHVVAGEGGTLVTGDAVNVAARLEQAAAPGEVLLGVETFRLVRDAVATESIEVVAKGKPEPLAAHRLTALDRSASGLARRLETPMVGRVRERERLAADFADVVATGSTRLFTLIGPAGVGKSRLVADFLERVGGSARVAQGRALSYGDGITYWPLVEVLLHLGVDPDAAICSSPGDTQLATRALFEQLAEERPLVLVFDDLHWAEPPLLDLVEHVADWSRAAPIFLLGIARPELLDVRPGWAGGKLNATSVLLEPLPLAEAEALAERLLVDLDAESRKRIVETAEGNPLFLEELAVLALESGAVDTLPSTIQAVLQARIDRLSHAERSVIERGAVEGSLFHRGAVAALAPPAEADDVSGQLLSLVRKELVRPERAQIAGDDAFRFRHLLIRDAAYEALPKASRAELHERFADWLDAHGDLVEQDEIVGYHLEQAVRYRRELGEDEKATLELARRAADRLGAAGVTANLLRDVGAATHLLWRAVDLTSDAEARRALLPELIEALIATAGHTETDALLAELEAGGERDRATATALRAISWVTGEATFEELRDEVERAHAVVAREGDALGMARCERALGTIEWIACDAPAAYEAFQRAFRHLLSAGRSPLEGDVARWLLMAAALAGASPGEMIRLVDELEAELRDRGPLLAATLHAARCRAGYIDGSVDAEEVRETLARLATLLREVGSELEAASNDVFLGRIAWAEGDDQRVTEIVQARVDEHGALLESGRFLANALAELALLECVRGDAVAAENALARGRALARDDDVADQIMLGLAESFVHGLGGRAEASAATLAAVHRRLAGIRMAGVENEARYAEARMRAALGERDEARRLLEALVDDADRRGWRRYADRYRVDLARLA